jgi:epoxyqueuosine reductase
MTPAALRDRCLSLASELGFPRVGVAALAPPRRHDAYRAWLEAGYHGEMGYMAAPDHVAARADFDRVAAGARTAIVVAAAYLPRDPEVSGDRPRGRVARYARGADYHEVLKGRLARFAAALAAAADRPILARPCVDSAPVLERELAEKTGIGFVGKNTMLISPGLGSYTVLGELFTDLEIAPTDPGLPAARCGECRACLEACPTGALVAPMTLDARRCISYLTIEIRGDIPEPLRPAVGDMIFGCDVCQDVCPYNAAAPDRAPADEDLGAADVEDALPDLLALVELGSGGWKRWMKGRAPRRAGRAGMLRNVCVALGNAGDRRALPALRRLAESDPSEVVRRHARWAIERLVAPHPGPPPASGRE